MTTVCTRAQGSTEEAAVAEAKTLFSPSTLFPLSKKASRGELDSLVSKLNADKEVSAYVRLTDTDIVPSHLLKEVEGAVRLLCGIKEFWSEIKDQADTPTGVPGKHPKTIVIWALREDAVHIWNVYI